MKQNLKRFWFHSNVFVKTTTNNAINGRWFCLGALCHFIGCYFNWLPIVERRDYHLTKLVFKAIHFCNWPSYLKLEERKRLKIVNSLSPSSS